MLQELFLLSMHGMVSYSRLRKFQREIPYALIAIKLLIINYRGIDNFLLEGESNVLALCCQLSTQKMTVDKDGESVMLTSFTSRGHETSGGHKSRLRGSKREIITKERYANCAKDRRMIDPTISLSEFGGRLSAVRFQWNVL